MDPSGTLWVFNQTTKRHYFREPCWEKISGLIGRDREHGGWNHLKMHNKGPTPESSP
jgi:hypothetical protein